MVSQGRADRQDLTLSEIKEKVAEATRLDHLETLLRKYAQQSVRTQRSSRSRYRKRNFWQPMLYNLAFMPYKRSSKNHVGLARKWNRDAKSAVLRKHWERYMNPLYYRRNFPVLQLKSPSARRTNQLVNRLQKTLVVKTNGVYGVHNLATPSCKYSLFIY